MKNLFSFTIIMLFGTVVIAQEVVSSAGETHSGQSCEVSWTIGEPVTKTYTGAFNILTQGLHQTKLTVTPINELMYLRIELKVFPNPSSDFVLIQFSKLMKNSSYRLYDLAGKLLESKPIISTETKIDLRNYASRQYILKLTKNSTKPIQTFKIIKK